MLRVLALDHYFDQDLRALEAHPELDVRRIGYERIRRIAIRMMGDEVARDLETFTLPALATARERYARWLRREIRRLYIERAFDMVILPSDTFFYVRALPDAAHSLGIPVVVVQKETTLSPDWIESFHEVVRRYAPFICDYTTVCSQDQRDFWINCGARPEVVEITGQPRFDLHASAPPPRTGKNRTILFFSYELDAYVPGTGSGMGWRTWEPLRSATENVLLDLARGGDAKVVIKAHPQQNVIGDTERLRAAAGDTWGRDVVFADLNADARELIRDADVVVGFQTTALFEAVASGRPTIYAAWGNDYENMKKDLVPFHDAPTECLRRATSADHLRDLLSSDLPAPSGCESWYEVALGPVDGHATERTVRALKKVATDYPMTPIRRSLDRRRRASALLRWTYLSVAEAFWAAAIPLAKIVGKKPGVDVRYKEVSESRRRVKRAVDDPQG
ncbi:MAG: hypothetical protein QOH90_280 [Actinomycetota bacterium]|nr:hypothetical protein [Actinomycetota bacterium]